jgi:hypothetical protein
MEEAIVNINDTGEDVDIRDILVKENSQLLLIHTSTLLVMVQKEVL